MPAILRAAALAAMRRGAMTCMQTQQVELQDMMIFMHEVKITNCDMLAWNNEM